MIGLQADSAIGVGGLYTAMMLESLDIPYKIIEASNRTGGRLMTHRFSDEEAQYYVSSRMLRLMAQ